MKPNNNFILAANALIEKIDKIHFHLLIRIVQCAQNGRERRLRSSRKEEEFGDVTRDMWRLIYSLCQSLNQVVIMMNFTNIYKERSSSHNKEAFIDR